MLFKDSVRRMKELTAKQGKHSNDYHMLLSCLLLGYNSAAAIFAACRNQVISPPNVDHGNQD